MASFSLLPCQLFRLSPGRQRGAAGGNARYAQIIAQVRILLLESLPFVGLTLLPSQCILALSDAAMGIVVLPTVIAYSRILTRLAIGLDKRPELVAHLTRRESIAGYGLEMEERVTLVEGSANVIREAFKKCLSERSGNTTTGLNAEGKPEGRRVGIYLCASLCLKLFFQCRKLRSAEQIFGNIYQQSPPLSCFPASQRVTFLFYLGRYLFANNHFGRALLALQAAYDQCHARCLRQRRSILIYLIPANIIMGRFPSNTLLARPEAAGLGARFIPICHAIRHGDVASFRRILDIESISATWFLERRILLPLQNRCEVLLWRSLARQTFLVSGFVGDGTRKAPSFELEDLLTLVQFLERRARTNVNGSNDDYDNSNNNTSSPLPSATPPRTDYIDPDLAGEIPATSPDCTIEDVEAAVGALINQNLLHGYLSHKFLRFIVTGAKSKSPLQVGFPGVWETLSATATALVSVLPSGYQEVPGWVRDDLVERDVGARGLGGKGAGAAAAGGGMVVNLKGARPVGVAPA